MDNLYAQFSPDKLVASALARSAITGYLDLTYMGLETLPELPPTVKQLLCGNNLLKTIESLPPFLEELHCDNNPYLRSIRSVPPTLKTLRCNFSAITSLPDLPAGLQQLYCDGTNIETLPDLPPMLRIFSCEANKLKQPYKRFVLMYHDDYEYADYDLEDLKQDIREYNARKAHKAKTTWLEESLIADRFSPRKIQRNMNMNKVDPEGDFTNEMFNKYVERRGEVWTEGVGTKKGGKRKKTKQRKTRKTKQRK